jgi:hypothetical protein
LKEEREMSEGNPEREGQHGVNTSPEQDDTSAESATTNVEGTEQHEGETQHPAPEEDVDVPPPDEEEIRRGVEKGTEDAFKS